MPNDPRIYDLEEWKRATFERKESPEDAILLKECITEDEEKQIDEKARKVTIAFSTSQIDRDGDVIRQRGIDLENFRKNPVVLFAHGGGFMGGGDAASKLPIASATKLFMNAKKTKSFAVDQFVPRDMPVVGALAEANFRMLTTKLPDSSRFILNAASIGFRPKKASERKVADDEEEFFFPTDFEATEKLEHSIVPVPANPGALRAAKQAGIELAAVAQWAEALLDNLGKGEAWHPGFTREQLEKAWDISNGEKKTFLAAVFDKGVPPSEPPATTATDPGTPKQEEEGMTKQTDELDDQLKRFEEVEVPTKAGDDSPFPVKGARLAARLNELIDGKTDDDTTRGDVIESMGSAAGISASTVQQILNGQINCPPLQRLQGFARALGTSVTGLVTAGEADGCDYSADDDEDRSAGACAECKAKEEEMKEIEEKLDAVLEENKKTQKALAILLENVKVEGGDPPAPPAPPTETDTPAPVEEPPTETPPAPTEDEEDPVVLQLDDDDPEGDGKTEDGKEADFAATLSKLATESLAELLTERGSAN